MASQNSIIGYCPQPYFDTGSALATVIGYGSVTNVENSAGIFDPDLSNYTTINADPGVDEFAFQIDFDKMSGHLANADMTVALIGCSLLTYEDDGAGAPDLNTEFPENIACLLSCDIGTVTDELFSYAHNSDDSVFTFDREPMPSIISGGRSNLLFYGLGKSSASPTATVYASIQRTAANALARPHAKLVIGHLYVGVDLTITLDPRTFGWSLNTENVRFKARDWGAVNADGTLVKRSIGEIIKISHGKVIGSEITAIATEIETSTAPNLLDLIKANTSYPLLFNPFPVGPLVFSSLTTDEANLSARSNFFSIYGFMPDPLELQTDDYRDGLNSLYRARFRIEETR